MGGHANVAIAVEAMKEGAVDLIEKLYDDALFLAAIRSAVVVREENMERDAQVS